MSDKDRKPFSANLEGERDSNSVSNVQDINVELTVTLFTPINVNTDYAGISSSET